MQSGSGEKKNLAEILGSDVLIFEDYKLTDDFS